MMENAGFVRDIRMKNQFFETFSITQRKAILSKCDTAIHLIAIYSALQQTMFTGTTVR